MPTAEAPPRRRLPRAERERRAHSISDDHDGVAHRADLRAAGVTRDDIRTEIAAGRWRPVGRHTVQIGDIGSERARLWAAVWESRSGARLDGASALIAAGMTGIETDVIDVILPASSRPRPWPGVRRHRPRSTPDAVGAGIPRVPAPVAAVNAAMWAVPDRQAALLICLAVQQRIVPTDGLGTAAAAARGGRSLFVRQIVADVCDGAHSLGELDVGRLCAERGPPAPSRQRLCRLPRGVAYLDLTWEDAGLTVEVDGSHRAAGVTPVEDALRQNEVTITGDRVLRIPLLGLRLEPERFLDQIERGLVVQDARYVARSA